MKRAPSDGAQEHLRQMKIHVSEPSLVGSLMASLRQSGCIVAREGEDTLVVSIPRSLREDAAQLELDLYLRAWEATHPGARALRVRER